MLHDPPSLEPNRTLTVEYLSLNNEVNPGHQDGASPTQASQNSPKLCDQGNA